ncbi:DUF971 domain-containing protein [Corticibacter populi]|uniref:DUF971 domain-containing protein n=1 Tax=Corticibacter populi TaxID=1550736 RepID=A0A3M6QZX4_9BURK|nr:DUF971 domain-containing protein [Corticibacter populi]RMX08463.1 DUF971 domain-containing protein [Corticibacter populi]RZS35775.1 DUF971 family protein [Corticibacter populi]
MAGLTPQTPTPLALTVHGTSRTLEVRFSTGETFILPFELLRVYSPSAEVQGHDPSQRVLQTGKRQVEILAVEPVGHYAVQPHFSDGHKSGIYSWDYLYEMGRNQTQWWADYEARLAAAGASRDAADHDAVAMTTTAGSCGCGGGACHG